jgi:hypothetical protein
METKKSQERYEDVREFVFRRVYEKGFRTGFNGYCERSMLEANCFPKYLAELASYSQEDFETVLAQMPREDQINDEYVEELRTRVQNPKALIPEDFDEKYPNFAIALKDDNDVRTYLNLYFLANCGGRDFRRNTLKNIAEDSERILKDLSEKEEVKYNVAPHYDACGRDGWKTSFKSNIIVNALVICNQIYSDFRELLLQDKPIKLRGYRDVIWDITEITLKEKE